MSIMHSYCRHENTVQQNREGRRNYQLCLSMYLVPKLIWKLTLVKNGELCCTQVVMVIVTAYIQERVLVLEKENRSFVIVSRSCEGKQECPWPNRS